MSHTAISLYLYSTAACHLCEQAQQVLENCRNFIQNRNPDYFLAVKVVDIVDDEHLLERYGVRIPVIRLCDSDRELGWPFDETSVLEFLEHS